MKPIWLKAADKSEVETLAGMFTFEKVLVTVLYTFTGVAPTDKVNVPSIKGQWSFILD